MGRKIQYVYEIDEDIINAFVMQNAQLKIGIPEPKQPRKAYTKRIASGSDDMKALPAPEGEKMTGTKICKAVLVAANGEPVPNAHFKTAFKHFNKQEDSYSSSLNTLKTAGYTTSPVTGLWQATKKLLNEAKEQANNGQR